jgi:hypothetical protein
MITLIALFVAGFITGILVGRNNVKTVEKAVVEALELYDKAQEELADLKKAKKKPAAKRKTTTKKA